MRFATKVDVPRFAREATVKVGLDVLSGIVKLAPVDSGRLRNSINVGIGSPDESVPTEGASEAEVIARGLRVLESAQAFSTIHFSSNLPYAAVWEFGTFEPANPGPSKDPRPGRLGRTLVSGGFSVQAPQGYVRVVAEQYRNTPLNKFFEFKAR